MRCANPVGAPNAHEIPAGGRRITVTVTVDWGESDSRDLFEKTLSFCSFDCARGYFAEKAVQHDGEA